jgi:hypothetical protein
MTYLELVQRLHSEAARQGTSPTTIVSQTGMALRLVNWVQAAWEELQSEHESWLFRRTPFSFTTNSGETNYTRADLSYDNLSGWRFNPDPCELSGIRLYSAVADENDLEYVPWDDYRNTYRFGASRSQSGRPTVFSIDTAQAMELWPIPDDTYTVNGEYYMGIDDMPANDTVSPTTGRPAFIHYHLAIVWKALQYYGAFEGAPEVYAHGQEQYDKMLAKLEITQLEKMTYGAPLA